MRLLALMVLLLLLHTSWGFAAEQNSKSPGAASEVTTPVPVLDNEEAVSEVRAQQDTTEQDVESESSAESDVSTQTPEDKRWVYIYEDGCAVGYKVDEEWELYEVERKDIRQGNADLMREVSACGSVGKLTIGAAVSIGNGDQQLAINGPEPDGPVAAGKWRRRTNGSSDWQELYFDFGAEDSHSFDYDLNTLRGNWDIASFTRNGNVWALQSNDDSTTTSADSHYYVGGPRARTHTDVTFRNGSADGGSWRASLRHYDTEIGATVPQQPDDSQLTRLELSGRLAECDTTMDASAFVGSYRSNRAQLDNNFRGVRLDSRHWLGSRLELKADGSLTRIDVGIQDASATRSDYN
ncbi:MAG: hypothetical protein M3R04_08660, partial [bacterium]|nr:hypothetical protein [bacterium]